MVAAIVWRQMREHDEKVTGKVYAIPIFLLYRQGLFDYDGGQL